MDVLMCRKMMKSNLSLTLQYVTRIPTQMRVIIETIQIVHVLFGQTKSLSCEIILKQSNGLGIAPYMFGVDTFGNDGNTMLQCPPDQNRGGVTIMIRSDAAYRGMI
mmetsp:Transcript_6778/g.6949  ORF Transcript_6778/g.6949 Transcript_6778/m.6949 type:complete len:106 (+) Transcript_6778:81-398(+)